MSTQTRILLQVIKPFKIVLNIQYVQYVRRHVVILVLRKSLNMDSFLEVVTRYETSGMGMFPCCIEAVNRLRQYYI